MTQPPLSLQIKELKEELGVQLLIRDPRGVRWTTVGIAFLNDAKDVLARAESARHRARHQKDATGGFVRTGYAPSTGHMTLPRVIRRLRALRPAAKLEVREMFSSTQGQALQSNEIDVGLVRPPVNASLVVLGARLSDPYCLAVPDGHALAVKGPIDLPDVVQEVFVSSTRPRGPAFPAFG
jgi:DNA-binding transcriptional LysR family regulator